LSQAVAAVTSMSASGAALRQIFPRVGLTKSPC